jgi:hypothetical protein
LTFSFCMLVALRHHVRFHAGSNGVKTRQYRIKIKNVWLGFNLSAGKQYQFLQGLFQERTKLLIVGLL